MYTYQKLPVRPVLADVPPQMPLDVLLALPEYVTRDPLAPRHNLVADIKSFLRQAGWEGAIKIIKPHIWAPGWDDWALEVFAKFPFVRDNEVVPYTLLSGLRAEDFLRRHQYEIVHFTGYVIAFGDEPTLYLGDKREMRAGQLRDALVVARTRLLILHVPADQFDYAARMAELVCGGGGPATLVVSIGRAAPLSIEDLIPELLVESADGNWGTADPQLVSDYFSRLYLDIIHNFPLPRLGTPPESIVDGLNVRLFYGADSETLLDFTRWMDALQERMRRIEEMARWQKSHLNKIQDRFTKVLHRSQRVALEDVVRHEKGEVSALVRGVNENVIKLNDVRTYIHEHEGEGVIPLSAIAEAVPQLEDVARSIEQRLPAQTAQLERTLREEAMRAPRVLNANFRDPGDPKEMLPVDEGLKQGGACELLLDVGPAWDKIKTIVKGASAFPTESLPQDVAGWDIEVLLVSEDFWPRIATTRIWLPRAGGRSHPYLNGLPAVKSGPAVIPLHAPTFPKGSYTASFTATARLSLYYENNLMQSAVIKVGVARTRDVVLDEENSVEVDFVLTGNFHNADRFARRAVKLGGDQARGNQPIALSLTMNDDGNGKHRIIVRPRREGSPAATANTAAPPQEGLPPGWTTYDPDAARVTLELAREELRNCFFVRDQNGKADPQTFGLNNDNGKSREQFKLDLQTFALLGNTLFEMLTQDIQAAGGLIAARDWTQQVCEALVESSVIQVARTDHANYAFPWALVYEHPMPGPGPDFHFCPIIEEEWDKNGVRTATQRQSCPHKDEPYHLENVFCPYGFWGLKHIIEQPTSALRKVNGEYEMGEAQKEIRAGEQISMAVGITRALKNLSLLDTHLQTIRKLPGLSVVMPDATDIDMLRSVLQSPSVVYLACHGEYDAEAKLPYLGIGPSLKESRYRVYPNTLRGWVRTPKTPNLAAWPKNRPLVFINGCHTTDLKPGELLNFVSSFAHAGASGVIGTEISVQPPVAFAVAKGLLDRIIGKKPVGEALYEVRWELANKGNLLGLAYTMYCLADLHLVSGGK